MTLVVGLHLGDAVGVLADTRVTVNKGSSTRCYYDNAFKVYHRPPVIIGLAGAPAPADLLATKFQMEHLVPLPTAEAYSRCVDERWMKSTLLSTYADAVRDGDIHGEATFALIIAAEN